MFTEGGGDIKQRCDRSVCLSVRLSVSCLDWAASLSQLRTCSSGRVQAACLSVCLSVSEPATRGVVDERLSGARHWRTVVSCIQITTIHRLLQVSTASLQCRSNDNLVAGAAIIGGRGDTSPNILVGGRKGKCPPLIAHLVKFLGLR